MITWCLPVTSKGQLLDAAPLRGVGGRFSYVSKQSDPSCSSSKGHSGPELLARHPGREATPSGRV